MNQWGDSYSPRNPTLWRRVPKTSIQKSFSASVQRCEWTKATILWNGSLTDFRYYYLLVLVKVASIHSMYLWKIVFVSIPIMWQNGRNFADDIFNCIFWNENVWISIKISLKFVPKGLINNITPLVQTMAWCRSGTKPLSEPMMVILTYICVTQPHWVKRIWIS